MMMMRKASTRKCVKSATHGNAAKVIGISLSLAGYLLMGQPVHGMVVKKVASAKAFQAHPLAAKLPPTSTAKSSADAAIEPPTSLKSKRVASGADSPTALKSAVVESTTSAITYGDTTRIDSAALKVLLMVEPSPLTYCSGYANRFQALLTHLHGSTDDDVQLITTDVVIDKELLPKSWLGFPVHHTMGLEVRKLYPGMSLSLDFSAKALRVIAGMRPDLIHVSSPGPMVIAAILYARILQIPCIASYHTHIPVYVRSYIPKAFGIARFLEWCAWIHIRLFHNLFDQTIVTSPQIQEEFAEHGVKAAVWQKGVDTNRFHPRFACLETRASMMGSAEAAADEDAYLLVYVGRLGKEKRIMEMRDILEKMPSNTHLCIVGSGPHEEELKEHFKDTKTVFTGYLTGETLSKHFASADAFVMTSDSETLGFVVLESLASGVPVVGCNAGGIPHIIRHEQSGYLVETGDIDGYVDRLKRLKADPRLRQQLGTQGRTEMQSLTWERSMSNLRREHYQAARENFGKRPEQRLWRFLTFQNKKRTV